MLPEAEKRLLDNTRQKVREFLREVSHVGESEFPYGQSEEALKKLRRIFRTRLALLDQYDDKSDPAIAKNQCAIAWSHLWVYLPLVGFILRSTNVRNAFEIYAPLLRLARNVLEPNEQYENCKTKLVLSSEWEYSPLIYSDITNIEDFVLMGIPAPESSNPLLVPLAGHELGHLLWTKEKLYDHLYPQAEDLVIDEIAHDFSTFVAAFGLQGKTTSDLTTDPDVLPLYAPSIEWLLAQAQESFCDFVGLRIFGWSYTKAHAYLLAPKLSMRRSERYPNIATRAKNLEKAAGRYNVQIDCGYVDMFEDDEEPFVTRPDLFLLSIADKSLDNLIDDLISEADRLITAAGIAHSTDEEIDNILGRYKVVVPFEGASGFPSILNAAWKVHDQPKFWKGREEVQKKRSGVLKDLVLKNIEIYELEQRKGCTP